MNNQGKIPKTMKALVVYDKNHCCFESAYPSPVCGPNDIIIKTEACGICAGDVKCRNGAPSYWGSEQEETWVKTPFIPGHEFFGRIVEIGENVEGYQLGERVTAEQIVPCNECRFCKNGQYWMCQPHHIFGFQSSNNGGMAEYVKYSSNCRIHKIPQTLSIEQSLLIEPYGCSVHAVDRAQITKEDIVVISGAGTLGLGMVTYAKMKSPKMLIVLDIQDNRLNKAIEFGADLILNPKKCNVNDEIKSLTDGYGCDVYIEATGNPDSVVQGLSIIRRLGRFVEFSVFSKAVTVDWSIIGDKKELDILGSHLSPHTYPFVIEQLGKGALNTDGIVTRKFKLEQWEKAFDYATGKYGDLKVAFTFDV